MKKYNFFAPVYMSFFSKDIYKDVARNWGGSVFLFLLVLLAICWIPATFHFNKTISGALRDEAPQYIEQLPTININNGIVSINEASPHFIKDPDTNKVLAIIDTSGQFTNIDQTKAYVLLTKDKLFIKKDNNEVREYDLSKADNFSVDKTLVYDYLAKAKRWLVIAFYPAMLILSYLYRLLQVIIYAAIGAIIFNNIIKTDLDFVAILRLSIIAVTPVIIIDTVLGYLDISFDFQWLLYFVLSMVYLLFGIHANKVVKQEQ